MTRTDSLVVGTLVALLALIAGLVGVPSLLSDRRPRTPRRPARPSLRSRGRTRGRPRPARLGQPADAPGPRPTATSSRWSSPGSSGTVRPARSCPTSPSAGRSTRPARSGRSSSATTRAGTTASRSPPRTSRSPSGPSRTPTTTGPGAGSWNEVTVATEGLARRSCSRSRPRSVASSRRRPSRSPRPTSWPAIPVEQLADRSVRPAADRVRAVRGRRASTTTSPSSIPAGTILPPDDAGNADRRRSPTDSLATPAPTSRPARPVPYLAGIEFRFFDDPEKLAAAYREGDARRRVRAVARDDRATSAEAAGSRVLRYPGSTLTAVLLNLRPGHPEFADPGRPDRPARRDRPAGGRRRRVRHGRRRPPPASIPPASFLFDRGRRSAGRRTTRLRPRWRSPRRAGPTVPTAGACPRRSGR